MVGERQVDETPQALVNGANSYEQGRTGFHEQRWCCEEYTSSMGYPKTQTQCAEQPLDCSYRSFNISPLIGFKMVLRPYSSKWDLLVWIPLCSGVNLGLLVSPFKPLYKGEYISEAVISKKQGSRYNLTL